MRLLLLVVFLCGCSPAVNSIGFKSEDKGRFENSDLGLIAGQHSRLIRDAKSGAEYLVIGNTGIVRLEPSKK